VHSVVEALTELRAGRAVVIPTDTVYGLAASLDVAGAVGELFRLKGRPRAKAIPVLGSDAAALARVASFDDRARAAARLWPGPLTIVLARAAGFEVDLGGIDDGTVAVRVPAHPVALELLRVTGPLGVTSANLSGEEPVTTAAGAIDLFGDVPVVDGGTCDGEPSTVLDLTSEPRVLREGGIDRARIQSLMS
jgi:L-threonylcarbamoyladenylate synthase